MRTIGEVASEVKAICRMDSFQATEYLSRARKLKKSYGPGLATIYCWFFSVPQKWSQVEPKIFELMRSTDSFDLNTTLSIPASTIAIILSPMMFHDQIALQLKNFCKAVKKEYGSWKCLEGNLVNVDVFETFERLKRYANCRLTFKNLAAMKIIVGMQNEFVILDSHIGAVLGIQKHRLNSYRTNERRFRELLEFCGSVTNELKREGLNNISTAEWSLAVWFNKAKTHADRLLSLEKRTDQ